MRGLWGCIWAGRQDRASRCRLHTRRPWRVRPSRRREGSGCHRDGEPEGGVPRDGPRRRTCRDGAQVPPRGVQCHRLQVRLWTLRLLRSPPRVRGERCVLAARAGCGAATNSRHAFWDIFVQQAAGGLRAGRRESSSGSTGVAVRTRFYDILPRDSTTTSFSKSMHGMRVRYAPPLEYGHWLKETAPATHEKRRAGRRRVYVYLYVCDVERSPGPGSARGCCSSCMEPRGGCWARAATTSQAATQSAFALALPSISARTKEVPCAYWLEGRCEYRLRAAASHARRS